MVISLLDLESLYLPYHVAHLLVNAGEVVVEDALLGILGGEGVELGQRHVLRLLPLDVRHVEVGLAETYKGFSDGNNKKEKAK